ncbi:hypothetical protein D5086_027633 [Populus alba]|uniref:Uncharacterized protein n=1 Tax=Populus alba TaxID=43335 RepID=A0ACC4AVW1_POPAL
MGVLFQVLVVSILAASLYMIWRILFSCWISPARAYLKLKKNGFGGPTPNFPLGNHKEIKNISRKAAAAASSTDISTFSSPGTSEISNDIHSSVFPYFSQWQKSHGKTHDLLLLNLPVSTEGIHLLVRYRAISVHSRPRVPKKNEFRGDGKELGKA